MLAFMATPELNCPPPPKGEPGIGVFIIERGKLNAPLSRSLYRLQTLSKAMLLVPMLPSLSATAILPNHLSVSFGERLSCLGHHVRNGVEVYWLIFVHDLTANVTQLHRHSAVDLPLQSEVELMAHA